MPTLDMFTISMLNMISAGTYSFYTDDEHCRIWEAKAKVVAAGVNLHYKLLMLLKCDHKIGGCLSGGPFQRGTTVFNKIFY